AHALLTQALAIDEKAYGADHPKIATRLSGLADVLGALDRKEEARAVLERAVAIDEKSYGPEHPKVAERLCSLARVLAVMDDGVWAHSLLKRAVAINEKAYGPEHPKTKEIQAMVGPRQPRYRRGEPLDQAQPNTRDPSPGGDSDREHTDAAPMTE